MIQMVGGLYPEMEPFSAAGSAESGWAWQPGFVALNEGWFDEADQKLQVILEHGLVPCVVGAWGFYLQHMSVENMKRHWRELIARWSAYPVVWCLAGEVTGLDPAQTERAAGLLAGEVNPATLLRIVGRAVRSTAGSLGHGRVNGFLTHGQSPRCWAFAARSSNRSPTGARSPPSSVAPTHTADR